MAVHSFREREEEEDEGRGRTDRDATRLERKLSISFRLFLNFQFFKFRILDTSSMKYLKEQSDEVRSVARGRRDRVGKKKKRREEK